MMEVKENIMDKVTFKLAVVVWRTDHKKRYLQGGVGMSGGMQGVAGCTGDYRSAVGTSNRLCYCTLTENIRCLNK
jgi:hypothetical protein